MRVPGYRNGTAIGSYVSGGMTGPGALDALLSEARLYDVALTQQEIAALSINSVPEPGSLALLGLGDSACWAWHYASAARLERS